MSDNELIGEGCVGTPSLHPCAIWFDCFQWTIKSLSAQDPDPVPSLWDCGVVPTPVAAVAMNGFGAVERIVVAKGLVTLGV